MFDSVGNITEHKRLLLCALGLWRQRGDDFEAPHTLTSLSDTNRRPRLHKEWTQQAKEALEIYERLGETEEAQSLQMLAWLWCGTNQLDAAERAGFGAIDLLDEGEQFRLPVTVALLFPQTRSKNYEYLLSSFPPHPS